MSKRSCAYAAGKMYLIGEYAVVVPNHPAILVSINKGVNVTIESSDQYAIQSSKFGNQLVYLSHINNQVECDDDNYAYALAAINIVLKTIKQHEPFKVSVVSELDNAQNKKYGLGSSSAMTVAIIRALNNYFGITRSLQEVFKQSVLAQLHLSAYSSFGDLASSVYGGCIYYKKGSVDWIDINQDVNALIQQKWEGFVIESLPLKTLNNVVGYSGVHASSTDLVHQVFKSRETEEFNDFLKRSIKIVNQCKDAIFYDDISSFFDSIINYQNLLVYLQQISGVAIEIEIIRKMIKSANECKAFAKISGAGGGDCVLAFAYDVETMQNIKEKWQELGAEIIHSIKWG